MKIAKRLISIIMVAAIVIGTAACFGTGAAAVDNILGDANSDGAVNSFDALVVIRHCTGEIVLTGAQKKAADVDADGAINSLDALYILHFSIGKIKKLPAADEISSDRVHLIGNYWYDPATGQVTDDNGEGFLGFSYDAHEGIFYASNNAWQRTFGYTYIYDYAAPFIVCNFDTSRVFFNYDDKEWMVQLWKRSVRLCFNRL